MKTKHIHHHNCNAEEHKIWNRRDFLQAIGLAGGVGLTLSSLPVSAIAAPTLFTPYQENERILVLIRLKGGNDGLNTIVPVFDYGTYKAKRPSIYIKQNEIINLTNEYGIPKTMAPLENMWKDGSFKIINNVGYEDHNLSHFTSSDIWNSANRNIESDENKSGWLGRYLLSRQPDYLENLPEIPGAIKINSGSAITFHNQEKIDLAVNFTSPERLLQIAEKGYYYDVNNLPDDCYYGEQVGFIRSILNVTYKYAPLISDAFKRGTNDVEYLNDDLGKQLALVAKLIKGNLGTRIYMVTLEGFDTHENQNQQHPILMKKIAASVEAFFRDLKEDKLDTKVLALTFSEFGRRVAENEGGTDHGRAAPVLVFGPALNGNGVLGEHPSLTDLDANGNLKHKVDFRSIYATLLESWMCIPDSDVDHILGETLPRLDDLGIECLDVSSSTNTYVQQSIMHKAYHTFGDAYMIEYELPKACLTEISLYAITGQKLTTIVDEYQAQGKHFVTYYSANLGISPGLYIYKINYGRQTVSGKIIMV